MSKKHIPLLLTLVLLVPLVLVACGGTVETEPPPAPEETEPPAPEETEPPAPMVDPSGQTVTFWHPFSSGANLEGITAVVDAFNAGNEWGITVEAIAQGSQADLETAVNAAVASGDLPNLTAGFPNGMANWYGAGVISELDPFIADPDYGLTADELAAFYPGIYGGGTLAEGAQIGIPMHQSAQVQFYNFTWAQELGFASPPANTAEFKEQMCAASEANATDDDPDNDGTGGYVLFPGASNVAGWVFAFGGDLVDETGQSYALNSQTVLDVALFLKDLQDSGCTLTTPSFPNPEVATRKALAADSSTAGIPFQAAAFADAGNADEWGLRPYVGPDGNTAVNVFGQLVGIISTSPESDLASWLWIKFFTSPEGQALWVQSTAYFPSQTATLDLIGDYIAENPTYASGFDFLESGKSEPPLAAHGVVRGAIQDAFFALLAAGSEEEVATILEDLQATADELVAETQ
jgi:multiple sugar transport system substrate-binding protein/sn-glycerol 3-phosphate transport system substrate-binding protein